MKGGVITNTVQDRARCRSMPKQREEEVSSPLQEELVQQDPG